MQFRVPQNIAMEDRIIGPLTAIQFGILVVGGGISFFIYTSTSIPKPLNLIFGGLFAVITASLALGRFNNQPLYRFFRFIIAFLVTPRVRVWHKGGTDPVLITPSHKKDTGYHPHAAKHVSKDDLARLALVIDSRGKEGGLPPKQPAQPAKR